ncbi:NAD-dependent epimerase/dehydratase family protein [Actinocatenispora sera]|jgi:nucleoside-diphosphate-sugar epimerase|uniref:dTDP-glucose 4,6-dehydratase n=1 Tax=Actinocatenispora sera TaxID=390989 RepID=A0A810KWS7_9ACTN|nr:NAD(P)-dependent oxidoreductase [Actinocatenispora sera]BCJ26721.1 dTDP-glucose 4,6-dehydratase [Actinocatenispora sera]
MRIFLAGGSGVLGSRLVPELVAAGHEVTATTRHADRFDRLRGLGATPVQVDVYDAARLTAVVAEAAPELVMHELTDLSDFDTDANARLRREGTANLVAAALAAGVQRMTVQSITWAYRDGDAPAVEDDPLQPGSAIETMEDLVCRLPRATALRYGTLYGPGTWYAPGGRVAAAVLAGQLPATPAITSFLHVDDAVAATVQALDWPDGAYHLVDDEPAPATEWLPVYADRLGAPAPAVADVPVGTPRGRGASNAKARATGWTPIHPTWRTGFRHR